MAQSPVIFALRDKRARMAGKVDKMARDLAREREALATLDAVIRMFEPAGNPELIPSIRPTNGTLFFRRGELTRLCVSALRDAGKPMRARYVAEWAIGAKGLPMPEARVRDKLYENTRVSLMALARKGIVRRIVEWPETWWELAG